MRRVSAKPGFRSGPSTVLMIGACLILISATSCSSGQAGDSHVAVPAHAGAPSQETKAEDAAHTGSESSPAATRVERGMHLYTEIYKCYACHGYAAQTGPYRLLPLRFPEAAFVHFVQNSPNPQMPAYPDADADELSDIHSYLMSLPFDESPPTPALLEEIRSRYMTRAQQ